MKSCFFCLQIRSYFTDRLLKIVRDLVLHTKGKGKSKEDEDNVYKGDPALEFIKHVCAVLVLDQNVQHDILVVTNSFVFIYLLYVF